jgi:hypothetical protein
MASGFEMTKENGDSVVRSREIKESENGSDYYSPDDNALMRLGKKPVLKVSFSRPVHCERAANHTGSVTLASCPFWASAVPSW